MSQDGRSARAKNIYDEAHKNLVDSAIELFNTVSYTHLTLPTIYSV